MVYFSNMIWWFYIQEIYPVSVFFRIFWNLQILTILYSFFKDLMICISNRVCWFSSNHEIYPVSSNNRNNFNFVKHSAISHYNLVFYVCIDDSWLTQMFIFGLAGAWKIVLFLMQCSVPSDALRQQTVVSIPTW